MRRRLAAALLTTTVLLAGCTGGSERAEPTPSSSAAPAAETDPADLEALQAVEVEGDPGSEPSISFEQPFEVSGPVAYVETEGSGAALEDGQSLTLQYVAFSGEDGSVLQSTWETDQPQQLTLGDEQVFPQLTEALVGQSVGARLLFASPGVEGEDEATSTPATIMTIDVVDARTVPTRAEGEPVEPPAGLPEVTLADDGAPTITIPEDAEEPTELVVQPLIKGDGPEVESGQTVTFQYTGALWDGTVFDSSWQNGSPFTTQIGTGSVIQGWDQGLVGQTVGSQVLLVIPPELGYGDQDNGTIPPNSTLVFVVDILDAS